MGKKQGQAQRTKGNAQPSSSAKAAEMLQQVSMNSIGYSFSSEIPPIGIGTLIEDSFDSSLDSEFRVALKKLYKKDTLTKSKALDELKNLIETKSADDCLQILPYWSKLYTKLSLDNDRRIRELCQINHEKLCSKVNKNLAPYLKTIMPYWLLAQSDSHLPTSRLAEQSFKNTFNETKRPEVVYFAREEILNVIYDYLIIQTYKTLSDLKSVSEDEAIQKFESVVCICLRGLDLFLKYYLTSAKNDAQKAANLSIEKLEKILMDQKFWKYSKDNSLKIRAEFFQLQSSLIDLVLLNDLEQLNDLKQNLKQKLIPLVFYACEEDNQTCAFFIWQCIVKCTINMSKLDTNFWSLLNVKKAFIPKLINLLRSHANQNANSQNIEIIYSSLLPLISKLTLTFNTPDQNVEKLQFYNDVFTKLNDSILKETRDVNKFRFTNSSKLKIIEAIFDLAKFVINELTSQTDTESKEFLNKLISDYILALFNQYLLNKLNNNSTDFENKFIEFIYLTIDTQSNDLKQPFWSQLNTLIIDKFKISENLNETQINEAESNLNLIRRVGNLFKPYWLKTSTTNDSFNLLNLIKIIFAQFLIKFKTIITSNEFKNNDLTHLDDLAYFYLSGISLMCFYFKNDSLISSILTNFEIQSTEFLVDHLIELVKHRQNDLILFGLIDLYFILNGSVKADKLDTFLLDNEDENLKRLDSLFVYYFKSKKSVLNNKLSLVKWFIKSDKFANVFTIKYLHTLDESNRFDLVFEFIHYIESHDQTDRFYNSIIKSIINLTNRYLQDDNDRSRLNDLVEFTSKILFNLKRGLNDQNDLWTLLIDCFKLKLKTSNSISNLNDLIDRLTSKLFKLIYDKSTTTTNIFTQSDDYTQLTQFITSTLMSSSTNLNDYFQNELILIDLINQFDKTLNEKENAIEQFYSEILFSFKNQLHFSDLFKKLLFINGRINNNLLEKLYVDDDLNYIYSKSYSFQIFDSTNEDSTVDLTVLKQLKYSLTVLNVYFKLKKENSSRLISHLMNKTSLSNWWLYLLLSSVLVTKLEFKNVNYDIGVKLCQDIKHEMSYLLNQTSFLQTILNCINISDFSVQLNKTDQFELELNHLSLFLSDLANINIENDSNNDLVYLLNKFAYDLSNQLINEHKMNEIIVKHYLYDLPFGKYSIVTNLTDIKQNTSHYLTLFETLVQNQVDLLKANKSLDDFNSTMCLFIKYIQFYVYYLKKTNTIDLTINKYLTEVLDLLIQQKESQKTYLIYYSDQNKKWNQFYHLDNLNSFLKLLFSFEINLSLNDKQWDFILCYSAALVQYLNKNTFKLTQLDESNELELFSVHFFQFVDSLVKRIQTKDHPKLNEWNGFFSKEIFDPLLDLFVNLADFYRQEITKFKKSSYFFNLNLKTTKLKLIKSLSSIVSQISFDRLMLNSLEPKLNVLDLNVDPNRTSIKLTDSLKSVFNHLIPHLKHEIKSFQLGSYKILTKIMNNLCTYYDVKTNEIDSDINETASKNLNIFESLPHVLKELLFELNDLFSNLKTNIHFEENILVTKLDEQDDEHDQLKLNSLCHDVNRKLMSYLLVNRLILDMFTSENLDFKVRLVNDLREISFNDYLMHCLFRLMPKNAFITTDLTNTNMNELISNESVQYFACQLYKHALKCVPAMIRDWYHIQPKRIADQVDKYTTKFISPLLIEEEIIEINRSANLINSNETSSTVDSSKKKYPFEDEEQSTIKTRGILSTREIVSTYRMKELNMELIIKLPINYPLGVLDVSSVRRLGVSENEWRNWLIQLTTYLTHQNGSIMQSLHIWKRNVDKKFSGVEECTICYNVIHGTNFQLPKKKCRTCKKLFHSVCLFKWFESSSKSTCPLCRNLF